MHDSDARNRKHDKRKRQQTESVLDEHKTAETSSRKKNKSDRRIREDEVTHTPKTKLDRLENDDDGTAHDNISNKNKKRPKRADTSSEINENKQCELERVDETHLTDEAEKNKKKSKKKKKKVEGSAAAEASGNISIRQMKREKHAQRMADAEAASHKAVQMHALSYLSLWKYNQAEWKFNKVKQIWLYKNKLDASKIPDELWEPLIEYFNGASDSMRKLIEQDCQRVISTIDAAIEQPKPDGPKPSDATYERARALLQNLNC